MATNPLFLSLRELRHSLYWRISLAFFALFLLLGLTFAVITTYSANRYYEETTQKLNARVAEYLLTEVPPFVDGKVNEEALGKIMHSMMAVNPFLEVYLLDTTGQILSFVVLDKQVKLKYVSLAPIREFLSSQGKQYQLGDNPLQPGQQSIFSAAEVTQAGQRLGYVYMVLASQERTSISSRLRNSYILQVGMRSFLLVLLAAFSIGLLVIWWLTRNLRRIGQTVKAFEAGDRQARIPVHSQDELGELSRSINRMSDTIVANLEELKQVDTLRKELIANISHDLRTPLAVIHGYVETLHLKKDSLNPEDHQKYLGIILKSTEKLKRLVNDLFELSKLEARQIKPQLEVFTIQELLSDVVGKYHLLTQQKGIALHSEWEQQALLVRADLALIERVMQNLLDNALKFTPTAGQVRISAVRCENTVQIEVQNTGKGIAEEDQGRIFDRYFKGNHHPKSGSGLGLAIVKNILEIHQSSIGVRSSRHEPTTFYFSLPLCME
jgi:signal transduction histidine kinase